MLDVVQSLWIGSDLSEMEKLSINSFLRNGHPYHLYTYVVPEGIPDGVVIKDANEIIPQYGVFQIRGGYSSFSDFFRWKLILEKGGWWVDTDAVCLRPFDFKSDYVFIGGRGLPGSSDCITSGIFKAPAGSAIMNGGWNDCLLMNRATMAWGAAGPPLFTMAVHKFDMLDDIVPGRLFFPVFYTEAPQAFIDEDTSDDYGDAYSVHLFNEIWRLAGTDKNATYPSSSAYEKLKKRFR